MKVHAPISIESLLKPGIVQPHLRLLTAVRVGEADAPTPPHSLSPLRNITSHAPTQFSRAPLHPQTRRQSYRRNREITTGSRSPTPVTRPRHTALYNLNTQIERTLTPSTPIWSLPKPRIVQPHLCLLSRVRVGGSDAPPQLYSLCNKNK